MVTLLVLPIPVILSMWTGPPLSEAPAALAPTGEAEALEVVKDHFRRGDEAFTAEDFASAVQEYTASCEAVPNGTHYNAYRARCLSKLVDSYRALDNLEPSTQHRCAAKDPLQRLLELGPLPADLEEMRAEMLKRQEKLAIDCHQPEETAPPPPGRTTDKPPGPPPPGPDPIPPIAEPKKQRTGRPQLIAGSVITGLGFAALAGMATSLVLGQQATRALRASTPQDDRAAIDLEGRHANNAAIATGIVAGVATITGVVLLIVGRRGARSTGLSLAPRLRPGSSALSLQLRF